MLYGLEAIAAMKSGPDELKRYHQQVLDEEKRMADETTQAAAAPAPARRTRKPRTPKAAPSPGAIIVKLELSASEAEAMLGYLIRTGLTSAAHQVVDAIAKAAKNGN